MNTPDKILTTALRANQIPGPDSIESTIWQFALTFDYRAEMGKDYGDWEPIQKLAHDLQVNVDSLTSEVLRALLLFEQRRHNHLQSSIPPDRRARINKILEELQHRISAASADP